MQYIFMLKNSSLTDSIGKQRKFDRIDFKVEAKHFLSLYPIVFVIMARNVFDVVTHRLLQFIFENGIFPFSFKKTT